jgi:hypothetical protein
MLLSSMLFNPLFEVDFDDINISFSYSIIISVNLVQYVPFVCEEF